MIEFEHSRYIKFFENRASEEVKVAPFDLDVFLQQKYPAFEQGILDMYRDREIVREELTGHKQLMQNEGQEVPPFELTTDYILWSLVQNFYKHGQAAYEEKNYAEYIIFSDLLTGLDLLVGGSKNALRLQKGETSEQIDAEVLRYTEKTHSLSPAESAELYIRLGARANDLAEIFKQDPFLVLDYYVNLAREMTPEETASHPSLIVAGAELGRKIYELVYPVAQSI